MRLPWHQYEYDNFISGGYFNGILYFSNHSLLADKAGIAVAWPMLGGKNTDLNKMEDDICNVIKKLIEDYNIDESQIFLWGSSAGCTRVLYLAMNKPSQYKGLVLSAPAGLPSLEQNFGAEIRRLKELDIFLGRPVDDRFPKELTLNFINYARENKVQIQFKEFPSGHISYREDRAKYGYEFLKNSIN